MSAQMSGTESVGVAASEAAAPRHSGSDKDKLTALKIFLGGLASLVVHFFLGTILVDGGFYWLELNTRNTSTAVVTERLARLNAIVTYAMVGAAVAWLAYLVVLGLLLWRRQFAVIIGTILGFVVGLAGALFVGLPVSIAIGIISAYIFT